MDSAEDAEKLPVKNYGIIKIFAPDGRCKSYALIKKLCRIGSDIDADITLYLPNVEKNHCHIMLSDDGDVSIAGLIQNKPILVNGKYVHHKVILKHNDRFSIMGKRFKYENPTMIPSLKTDKLKWERKPKVKMDHPPLSRTPEPQKTLQECSLPRRSASAEPFSTTSKLPIYKRKGGLTRFQPSKFAASGFVVKSPQSDVKPSLRSATIMKNATNFVHCEPECDEPPKPSTSNDSESEERRDMCKTPVSDKENMDSDSEVSTPLNNTSVVVVVDEIACEVPMRSIKSRTKDQSVQRLIQHDESLTSPKSAMKKRFTMTPKCNLQQSFDSVICLSSSDDGKPLMESTHSINSDQIVDNADESFDVECKEEESVPSTSPLPNDFQVDSVTPIKFDDDATEQEFQKAAPVSSTPGPARAHLQAEQVDEDLLTDDESGSSIFEAFSKRKRSPDDTIVDLGNNKRMKMSKQIYDDDSLDLNTSADEKLVRNVTRRRSLSSAKDDDEANNSSVHSIDTSSIIYIKNNDALQSEIDQPSISREKREDQEKVDEDSDIFDVSGVSPLSRDSHFFPRQKLLRTYGKSTPRRSPKTLSKLSDKLKSSEIETKSDVATWIEKSAYFEEEQEGNRSSSALEDENTFLESEDSSMHECQDTFNEQSEDEVGKQQSESLNVARDAKSFVQKRRQSMGHLVGASKTANALSQSKSVVYNTLFSEEESEEDDLHLSVEDTFTEMRAVDKCSRKSKDQSLAALERRSMRRSKSQRLSLLDSDDRNIQESSQRASESRMSTSNVEFIPFGDDSRNKNDVEFDTEEPFNEDSGERIGKCLDNIATENESKFMPTAPASEKRERQSFRSVQRTKSEIGRRHSNVTVSTISHTDLDSRVKRRGTTMHIDFTSTREDSGEEMKLTTREIGEDDAGMSMKRGESEVFDKLKSYVAGDQTDLQNISDVASDSLCENDTGKSTKKSLKTVTTPILLSSHEQSFEKDVNEEDAGDEAEVCEEDLFQLYEKGGHDVGEEELVHSLNETEAKKTKSARKSLTSKRTSATFVNDSNNDPRKSLRRRSNSLPIAKDVLQQSRDSFTEGKKSKTPAKVFQKNTVTEDKVDSEASAKKSSRKSVKVSTTPQHISLDEDEFNEAAENKTPMAKSSKESARKSLKLFTTREDISLDANDDNAAKKSRRSISLPRIILQRNEDFRLAEGMKSSKTPDKVSKNASVSEDTVISDVSVRKSYRKSLKVSGTPKCFSLDVQTFKKDETIIASDGDECNEEASCEMTPKYSTADENKTSIAKSAKESARKSVKVSATPKNVSPEAETLEDDDSNASRKSQSQEEYDHLPISLQGVKKSSKTPLKVSTKTRVLEDQVESDGSAKKSSRKSIKVSATPKRISLDAQTVENDDKIIASDGDEIDEEATAEMGPKSDLNKTPMEKRSKESARKSLKVFTTPKDISLDAKMFEKDDKIIASDEDEICEEATAEMSPNYSITNENKTSMEKRSKESARKSIIVYTTPKDISHDVQTLQKDDKIIASDEDEIIDEATAEMGPKYSISDGNKTAMEKNTKQSARKSIKVYTTPKDIFEDAQTLEKDEKIIASDVDEVSDEVTAEMRPKYSIADANKTPMEKNTKQSARKSIKVYTTPKDVSLDAQTVENDDDSESDTPKPKSARKTPAKKSKKRSLAEEEYGDMNLNADHSKIEKVDDCNERTSLKTPKPVQIVSSDSKNEEKVNSAEDTIEINRKSLKKCGENMTEQKNLHGESLSPFIQESPLLNKEGNASERDDKTPFRSMIVKLTRTSRLIGDMEEEDTEKILKSDRKSNIDKALKLSTSTRNKSNIIDDEITATLHSPSINTENEENNEIVENTEPEIGERKKLSGLSKADAQKVDAQQVSEPAPQYIEWKTRKSSMKESDEPNNEERQRVSAIPTNVDVNVSIKSSSTKKSTQADSATLVGRQLRKNKGKQQEQQNAIENKVSNDQPETSSTPSTIDRSSKRKRGKKVIENVTPSNNSIASNDVEHQDSLRRRGRPRKIVDQSAEKNEKASKSKRGNKRVVTKLSEDVRDEEDHVAESALETKKVTRSTRLQQKKTSEREEIDVKPASAKTHMRTRATQAVPDEETPRSREMVEEEEKSKKIVETETKQTTRSTRGGRAKPKNEDVEVVGSSAKASENEGKSSLSAPKTRSSKNISPKPIESETKPTLRVTRAKRTNDEDVELVDSSAKASENEGKSSLRALKTRTSKNTTPKPIENQTKPTLRVTRAKSTNDEEVAKEDVEVVDSSAKASENEGKSSFRASKTRTSKNTSPKPIESETKPTLRVTRAKRANDEEVTKTRAVEDTEDVNKRITRATRGKRAAAQPVTVLEDEISELETSKAKRTRKGNQVTNKESEEIDSKVSPIVVDLKPGAKRSRRNAAKANDNEKADISETIVKPKRGRKEEQATSSDLKEETALNTRLRSTRNAAKSKQIVHKEEDTKDLPTNKAKKDDTKINSELEENTTQKTRTRKGKVAEQIADLPEDSEVIIQTQTITKTRKVNGTAAATSINVKKVQFENVSLTPTPRKGKRRIRSEDDINGSDQNAENATRKSSRTRK